MNNINKLKSKALDLLAKDIERKMNYRLAAEKFYKENKQKIISDIENKIIKDIYLFIFNF